MSTNPYIGHPSQLGGVEEHRLIGGKGDGIRLYEVHNEKGIDLTLSPDRCLDISRLRFKGVNLSYMTAAGYVAPTYFDPDGDRWLKSFTAGFLTTCGLEAVGSPCTDAGEALGLHGSIANTPSEHSYFDEDEDFYRMHALIRDEAIFSRKLTLNRTIEVAKRDTFFTVNDEIENTGDRTTPVEILYHMNMGYPLLDEDAVIEIPSVSVLPRDEHAAEYLANWMHMEKPQSQYQERCYYHKFADGNGLASIYQPKLGIRLAISFDSDILDGFVEWKMMGVRDYVLGLECGNCYPDGRDKMRESGILKFLAPGEKKCYKIRIDLH